MTQPVRSFNAKQLNDKGSQLGLHMPPGKTWIKQTEECAGPSSFGWKKMDRGSALPRVFSPSLGSHLLGREMRHPCNFRLFANHFNLILPAAFRRALRDTPFLSSIVNALSRMN